MAKYLKNISVYFILVAFLLIWEGSVRVFSIPAIIIPSPYSVAVATVEGFYRGTYFIHTAYTLSETIIGFLAGSILGIIVGTLISQIPLLERMLYPYLVLFQAMPKIAIAPLLILWFGFGITSKAVIAGSVALFPVLINVITGLKQVDPQMVELMRSLSANRWKIFRMVQLPSSLPFLFAGLNIAIVFSLLGAVVGEFIGAQKGLGNLIIFLNYTMDVAGAFSVIIYLSILGYFLDFFIRKVRQKVVFWVEMERVIGA